MSEIPIGPFDVKNIDEVVAVAKIKARVQNITDYDAQLEYFINMGCRNMGTKETTVKKSKPIDVIEGRAKLPCAFNSLIGVKPIYDTAIAIDESAEYCTDPLQESWYAEKNFLETCGLGSTDPVQHRGNTYEIVGGHIIFSSPFPANLTKCLVAYNGMNTDEDGLMIIVADYEQPLSAYAAWQLLMIYPEIYPQEFQPFYGTRLKALEKEYKEWRASVQSQSQRRHFENNKAYLRNINRALFVNNARYQ